ncbi:MAG: MerR family transcriptional regulator [Subdoligranulum sp.]|nr:MerR family transcriptional regulator [Subdoligranulum sp.]
MKINEVEALVGITKKNIRFYEEKGLLTPGRNSENGYRDYGEAEVAMLRRIKLLRKLGVPIEEIRRMREGTQTVGDGLRRHLVTLERERRNLDEAVRLCGLLQTCEMPLSELDAEGFLQEVETLERAGTTFHDQQKRDVRTRYVAPVVITVVFVALMAGAIGLFLWAVLTEPEEVPPLPLVAVTIAVPALMIVGVVYALVLRIREIGKGEIDDAKRY